jgi:hypothetical protein
MSMVEPSTTLMAQPSGPKGMVIDKHLQFARDPSCYSPAIASTETRLVDNL